MTFGYSGAVLLPVTISGQAGQGAALKLHASWLVCNRICVPEEGDFSLFLPAGSAAPSPEAGLFAAADAKTPRTLPWAAQISPGGTLSVGGEGLGRDAVNAWFIPARADALDLAAPQALNRQDGRLTLQLKLSAARQAGPLTGVLSIADRSGHVSFYDVEAPEAASDAVPPGVAETLGLALLGGLLLNLMPCVFPVLAMKAVGLARLSGAERNHARAHAGAYALGVLATFAVLGGALLALRATGSAAGWGFQFQSPGFVGAMALLLFAVGLNLSGVFEVGGRLANAGQSLSARGGLAGSFFAGLLAVLVATPCTAPFMATAIAAALAASPGLLLAVCLMMGVGLAAPYVLLASLPGAAGLLPRPGPWMELLRQALAFPMYGAAMWLVWVISQQAGPPGVLAAGLGLLLVGFAAWVLGRAQASTTAGRRRGAVTLALAAGIAALVVLGGLRTSTAPLSGGVADRASGETFSAARLAALRQAGRPVFVNMTAAWCITCLVNERVALAPEAVRQAFADRGVTYLKGDWTRADPEITTFLREHARDGVPLYVMYPADGHPAVILPQILTESMVLAALR